MRGLIGSIVGHKIRADKLQAALILRPAADTV